MPHRLSKDFCWQVQHLLSRHHKPLVIVQPSSVEGAGKGVFASDDIPAGYAACLYPGVYTPGLPLYTGILHDDCVYLAKEITPSGCPPEHNPYILNLHTFSGGYLDGNALQTAAEAECSRNRELDENPSACAHLVNHNRKANVEVISFRWRDILGDGSRENERHFALPNTLRTDGTPWYLDRSAIVRFPTERGRDERISLCGAAFCTRSRIEKGTELFLDYNLKEPVPAWASSWYTTS